MMMMNWTWKVAVSGEAGSVTERGTEGQVCSGVACRVVVFCLLIQWAGLVLIWPLWSVGPCSSSSSRDPVSSN